MSKPDLEASVPKLKPLLASKYLLVNLFLRRNQEPVISLVLVEPEARDVISNSYKVHEKPFTLVVKDIKELLPLPVDKFIISFLL